MFAVPSEFKTTEPLATTPCKFAVPSAFSVPVAVILAPYKSPEKNPPPWMFTIEDCEAVVVPSIQSPEVAVIPPTSVKS